MTLDAALSPSRVLTSVGPIEVYDTGGDGPVVLFSHGVVMDHTLFDEVVVRLGPAVRCVRPVLPLGGHRVAVDPSADISLHGQAALLAEVAELLDLRDVLLVASDWGGPLITLADHNERIAGAVLLPLEAWENIPPGLPGAFAGALAAVPGGFLLAARTMQVPGASRLPFVHGWMARRPIPRVILESWVAGLIAEPAVRHDVRRYVKTSDMNGLVDVADRLAGFEGPVEIVWSRQDKVMPFTHAERLAALLPNAVLTPVADSYTLVSLDQPDVVVDAVHRLLERAS